MYKIDDLAELLDMHARTIRRYIHEGKLIAMKVGGEWRVSEEELNRFLGKKVQQLHEESLQHVDEYLGKGTTEIDGIYQVCSIIDCYVDGAKAALISQELIQLLNADDPERGKAKFQYFYLQEEKKSRFIVWGKPGFVGKLLLTIETLSKLD
ncbi:helix-turn-helix domain-containing protein [Paenibacillus sp. NPDC058174]|uniref:helix-turn-helix domain-containing protein n=1 Tax=Paenibacillus sp. NPDC058174 TaxID=3346366 RepID=UPI0036DD5FFA